MPPNLQLLVGNILTGIKRQFFIIGVCETWLDADHVNIYQLTNFDLYSNHRNWFGGGVAMNVNDNLTGINNTELYRMERDIEYLGVECKDNYKKYYLSQVNWSYIFQIT